MKDIKGIRFVVCSLTGREFLQVYLKDTETGDGVGQTVPTDYTVTYNQLEDETKDIIC